MLAAIRTRLRPYAKVGLPLALIGLACATWLIGTHGLGDAGPQHGQRGVGGLICEEATWDFGVVDAVKTPSVSHEFILTNQSQIVVRIREVRSSCGCMVAEGHEKALSPSDSTRLRARVTLAPVPGPFAKELLVGVEGRSSGWLPLRVVGSIAANASLYSIPSEINFGTVGPGEESERVIQVRRYDGTLVELLEATGNSEAVRCSLDPDGPPVRWGCYGSSPSDRRGRPAR